MKQYSSKEMIIFLWFMLPYTLVINLLMFGSCIFSSLSDFTFTFVSSNLYFLVIYMIFGFVARLVNKRFSEDGALFRRIAAMLPLFYIMNIIMVQGLYLIYENIYISNCKPIRYMEWWVTGF